MKMINKIGKIAQEKKCEISLTFGSDGGLNIVAYGKKRDFTIIGSDWSEELIMNVIKDTVKRAKEK